MAVSRDHLAFLDHMHELDALQGNAGRTEGLETQHRPDDPFDGSMSLLHQIVQIFDLADLNLGTGLLDERLKGGGVGATLVDRDFVG